MRCATLRAWPQRWQSTAVTRIRREVIEESGGPDGCDDLVDGDMHGIRRQLLPGNAAGGIEHEDRMAVHRAHVHAAGKAEDAVAAASPSSVRAAASELRDGDKRGNEDYNAACDCVRPPLAIGGADRRSHGLRLRPARRRAAALLAHRASLLAARSIRLEASERSRTRPRPVRSMEAIDR